MRKKQTSKKEKGNKILLIEIFCEIDNFCKQYEKYVKEVRLMDNALSQ